MRKALSIAVVLASSWAPGRAMACACRGTAGPSNALTTSDDTVGFAATSFVRTASGAFDDRGGYHAYGSSVKDRAAGLTLALGARPMRATEVSVVSDASVVAFDAGDERKRDLVLGDFTLRVRHELVSAPPPSRSWVSLLAAGVAVRAPTATSASGSGAGSSPSSPGLGAWEGAVFVDMRLPAGTPLVEVALAIEVALRASDSATGVSRKLGPRVLGRAMLLFYPNPSWSFGAHADVATEGVVTYEGRRAPSSDQRIVSAGAWAAYKPMAWWRMSAFVVSGLPVAGKNGIVSSSVGLGFGGAW